MSDILPVSLAISNILVLFSCHSGYECIFNMLSSFNKPISDKCFYFKTSENRRLPGVFSGYKMRILARNGLKVIEKNIWESYNESEVTHISIRIFWPFLLNWNTFRDRLLKAWKLWNLPNFQCANIVWKVSKCGVFSGLHFPVFGLKTEIFIQTKKPPHFETFLITRSIQLKLLLKLLSATTANLINWLNEQDGKQKSLHLELYGQLIISKLGAQAKSF